MTQLQGILRHYTRGTKLLIANYKKYRQIKKKLATSKDSTLNWSDSLHIRRTSEDLKIGIPFVFVFALPIVGYVAPIFAVFAPRYIPSTFHSEKHLHSFMRHDQGCSKSCLNDLHEAYGLLHHSKVSPEGLEKMRQLLSHLEHGTSRINHLQQLEPLCSIQQDVLPNLTQLSRTHLLHLNQALRHSGFVPKYMFTRRMIVERLNQWRTSIWKDDQLLHTYGVETLTTFELVTALYERGIYRHPNLMSRVLARTQRAALESMDQPASSSSGGGGGGGGVSNVNIYTPKIEILEDWRQTLKSWIELHRDLQQQTNEKSYGDRKSTIIKENSNVPSQSDSTSPSVVVVAPSSSTPVKSTSSSRNPTDGFPLSFFVHLPSLARVPNQTNTEKHHHHHHHHQHQHDVDEHDDHDGDHPHHPQHRHEEQNHVESPSPLSVDRATNTKEDK